MVKKYVCIEKRLEGYTQTLTVVYLGVQIARDHFPSGLYVFIYDIHREHASVSFIIRRKKTPRVKVLIVSFSGLHYFYSLNWLLKNLV